MQIYDIDYLRYVRKMRQMIKKMYHFGYSVPEIAKVIEKQPKTVYRHLKEMGIPLRPRKRDIKTGHYLKTRHAVKLD